MGKHKRVALFIDPPAPYEPLEVWEEHLRELIDLPQDVAFRAHLIDTACRIIRERHLHEPGRLH